MDNIISKTENAGHASQGRKKFKIAVISACAVIILLGFIYFFLTSSFFIKAVILPKVSKAINAEVYATHVTVHPFSEVVISGLKISGANSTLLQAGGLKIKYNLLKILRGVVAIDEIELTTPVFDLQINADKSSNIDPVLKSLMSAQSKEPTAQKREKTQELLIKRIVLTNANFTLKEFDQAGISQQIFISSLNLTATTIGNGVKGEVQLSSGFDYKSAGNSTNMVTSGISGNISSKCSFTLGNDFNLLNISADAEVEIKDAFGLYSESKGYRGIVKSIVSSTNLEFQLSFVDFHNKPSGQILVSGPFSFQTKEGNLNVLVTNIDHTLLNFVNSGNKFDFQNTEADAIIDLKISNNASLIALESDFRVKNVVLLSQSGSSLPLDSSANLDFIFDLTKRNIKVNKFRLDVIQGTNSSINAVIEKPVNIAWSTNYTDLPDSIFSVSITNLNLADFSSLAGDFITRGILNAKSKISIVDSGNTLGISSSLSINDLMISTGTNILRVPSLSAESNMKISKYSNIEITNLSITASSNNVDLAYANIAGNYDITSQAGTLNSDLSADLQLFPIAISSNLFSINSGKLKANFKINLSGTNNIDVLSKCEITNLNAKFNDIILPDYSIIIDSNISHRTNSVKIQKLNLTFGKQRDLSDNIKITGLYDINKSSFNGDLIIDDLKNTVSIILSKIPKFNQLRIKLDRLSAISSVNYEPSSNSTVSADLIIRNLYLEDHPTAHRNGFDVLCSTKVNFAGLTNVNSFSLKILLTNNIQTNGLILIDGNGLIPTGPAQINFNISQLNREILEVFLKDYVNITNLGNINISASGSVGLRNTEISNLMASFTFADIIKVKADIRNSLDLKLNTAFINGGNGLDIKDFTIVLPGNSGTNAINIKGYLENLKSNSLCGNISIQGDEIDIGPLMDSYSLLAKSDVTKQQSSKPVSETESESKTNVKIGKLDASVNIRSLMYHDLKLSNIVMNCNLGTNTVKIQPLALSIDNRPISLTVTGRTDIPGGLYAMTLSASNINITPVVNDFLPGYSNQVLGVLSANGEIKGISTSGAILRSNLVGDLELSLTNAEIRLVSSKFNWIITPIAMVLGLNDLLESPVTSLYVKSSAGNGVINLDQLDVMSPRFLSRNNGKIILNDILTNSTIDIPITLEIERSLVQKLGLQANNTNRYVLLPQFAKITGTIGSYKTKVDEFALSKLILKSVTGVPERAGAGALNIITNIGSSLKNLQLSTNLLSHTNILTNPPAQKNPLGNLFNLLQNPKNNRSRTNN